MNIYTKKLFWKYTLGIFALLIIIGSFWYTSYLAKKIERDERQKLTLWAEAIQKKAKLVKYTGELFSELAEEERKKVELWAEATKKLASDDQVQDYTFVLRVVANNTTVPVVLTDDDFNVVSHRNLPVENPSRKQLTEIIEAMRASNEPIEIDIYRGRKNYLFYEDSRLFSELKQTMEDMIKSFISEIVINSASVPVLFLSGSDSSIISYGNIPKEVVESPDKLKGLMVEMSEQNEPITIDLGAKKSSFIYYQDSELLTHLTYYPFIQFGIIGLFILTAYWLFSQARKSEQNQVWVGLAKETAHQLGTPLSSLLAWVEILKDQPVDKSIVGELAKDINRLEVITDRFSKIGAEPKLDRKNVYNELVEATDYLKSRISNKVEIKVKQDETQVEAKLNSPLFNWVVENLCKNAVDAMNGKGLITISITDQSQFVYIDIADTGKGIPSSKVKTVFEPGYTTKQRGWGLGLSLAKRIIESYHFGKIFVKSTEPDKGTVFRIVLNK